jgi:6-phosphogluconolactonase
MSLDTEIVVLPDGEAVAREAAQRFAELATSAVESRGRFSVALSGGATPGRLYQLLAQAPYRAQVPWQETYLFWGDERCVPPEDPGSNYRRAEVALIRHVPIPPDHVCRIHGELEPAAASRAYTRTLIDFFCGPRPRFDLIFLGLGQDGHTASLFPGSAALQETERLAIPVEANYQGRPAHRVTLTLPAINAARQVLFLVTGSGKAEAVRAVIHDLPSALPAQQVRPVAGKLTWLLDAAAARLLEARG